MINLAGLWKKTDKNGNTYLSGKLGNCYISVFPNKQKKTDAHPDYNITISAPQNKGYKAEGDAPKKTYAPRQPQHPPEDTYPPDDMGF